MKLLFIGTGSGQTSLNRFHSSIYFYNSNENVLIDTGDGISKALLSSNVSANEIKNIIISHFHSDHLAGLPSLITQMIINNRSSNLKIFVHVELLEMIKKFLNISYIFPDKLDFLIDFVPFEFEREIIVSENFTFIAKQNSHITNKHNINLPSLNFISCSFLFFVGNKKVVYTSDIGVKDDLYLFQNYLPDIYITETSHVEFDEISIAAELLNPKYIYLTHISENELPTIKNWLNSLNSELKDKFSLAYDKLEVDIN